MRLIGIFIFAFFIGFFTLAQDTVFLENFEGTSKPSGWTEEATVADSSQGDKKIDWEYQSGGDEGHPFEDVTGDNNALFWYVSYNGEATMLITPPIDLKNKVKPELRFFHAQVDDGGDYDRLKVYFKNGIDSAWKLLQTYDEPIGSWQLDSILLPDSLLTKDCYIGFEAITGAGHGVVIDSVVIMEKEVKDREVSSLSVSTASTKFIPSGYSNMPILKIDIDVTGNAGDLFLDSLVVTSLNTSDDVLQPQGVKLYYTGKQTFRQEQPVGEGVDFSDGKAVFSGLGQALQTGNNVIWVTYDIETGDETIHGKIADARIDAQAIKIGDSLYPALEESPSGSRTIAESIFLDDFEADLGWDIPTDTTNEFEIDTARGLGGSDGNPDPSMAYSGYRVLGTDITGLNAWPGDYEPSIGISKMYQAISPTINCRYYKEIKLTFQRWLNAGFLDRCYIDISNDNGATWNQIFSSGTSVTEDKWSIITYDINSYARNKSQVKIRFSLGPTTSDDNYSGWNIDDVVITGDYITKDVGIGRIIQPVDGCGHSDTDSVKVVIYNYGAQSVSGDIPLKYVFQGGVTKSVTDTFSGTIEVNDSAVFTFDETVDLSSPYFYSTNEFFVTTLLDGDEDIYSDTLGKALKVVPTIKPPYFEDFEKNHGYWQEVVGKTWDYGKPQASYISTAASGDNIWVTNRHGIYYDNDSVFIESPCFDFSEIKNAIVELKYISETQHKHDGAAMYYSIDDGVTWSLIDTHGYDFEWQWYNNLDTVYALGSHGWDSLSGGWQNAKQMLPGALAYQPNVKFRFGFQADTLFTAEGFAIDDLQIYEAPHDVGVSEVIAPESACELDFSEYVTVAVKNYGIDTVFSGDTIIVAYQVGDSEVIDTVAISRDLPNMGIHDTIHLTSSEGFYMWQAGTYEINAFTLPFKREDDIYADTIYNNDSAKTSVVVRKPYVELGADIYSAYPDTILLDGSAGKDIAYYWGYVGQTDTLSQDSIFDVQTGGTYNVIASDTLSNCVAKDTLDVHQLYPDISIPNILQPNSACELGDSVPLIMEIKNNGTDTINGNYQIVISCYFDSTDLIHDTLFIVDTVLPDSSFQYVFDSVFDMSGVKEYSFSCYLDTILTPYKDDDTVSNDSAIHYLDVWGYPTFDLKPDDTTHVGFSYQLNAAAGDTLLKSFSWADGSADSTFLVDSQGTGYYAVTVADVHGCTSADTSKVRLVIPDVGIARIDKPTRYCGAVDQDQPMVSVGNYGTDTLWSGEEIPVTLIIDTIKSLEDTLVLNERFEPGDSVIFTFSDTFSIPQVGTYLVTAYTNLSKDSVPVNDTLDSLAYLYEIPVLDLGEDTIVRDVPSYTIAPDTTFDRYIWQNGDTAQTFTVTAAEAQPVMTAYLTVTDSNQCSVADQKQVSLLFKDIAVDTILLPDTACSLGEEKEIIVRLINKGTYSLGTGIDLSLVYRSNGGAIVSENTNIPTSISYNQTFDYTFDQPLDMTGKGDYLLEAWVTMAEDAVSLNDTMLHPGYLYGQPQIKWSYSNDTVVVDMPHNISLTESYESYLWSTGDTTSSIQINEKGWYAVTVTDTNQCLANDSTLFYSSSVAEIALNNNLNYSVFPNPANEVLNICFHAKSKISGTLMVVDEMGRTVESENFLFQGKKCFDYLVDDWIPGIYYSVVVIEDQRYISGVLIY